MSKKRDLGQLALMGLASGLVMAADANADVGSASSEATQPQTYLAAGGCGGKGGCGGMSGRSTAGKNNSYYRDYRKTTQQQQNMRNSTHSSVSERALLSRLSNQERATYERLSPDAKQLVLKAAAEDFSNQ